LKVTNYVVDYPIRLGYSDIRRTEQNMKTRTTETHGNLEFHNNYSDQVLTQIYNKADNLISEIIELDGKYIVENFSIYGGGYNKNGFPITCENYACAVLTAKKFCKAVGC
jgi:hypothetical protein